MKISVVTGILASVVLALAAPAYPFGAFGGTIDARSNIFGAGHAVPPDLSCFAPGLGPSGAGVDGSQPGIIQFASVTGTCAGGTGWPQWGPDGGTAGDTAVTSYGGISGISVQGHQLFLAGVFLDGTTPVDPPPATLNYSDAATQGADFSPQLRQVFFIGDGLTGTGSGTPQLFRIPSGATLLYIGFVDGWSFAGAPGCYGDNEGSLQYLATVTYNLANISSLNLNPNAVKGGRNIKGKVQLSAPAPAGGVSIPIVSANPAVVPGTTCQVNQGSRQGTFTLTTHAVASKTKVKITASSANSVSKTVKVKH